MRASYVLQPSVGSVMVCGLQSSVSVSVLVNEFTVQAGCCWGVPFYAWLSYAPLSTGWDLYGAVLGVHGEGFAMHAFLRAENGCRARHFPIVGALGFLQATRRYMAAWLMHNVLTSLHWLPGPLSGDGI